MNRTPVVLRPQSGRWAAVVCTFLLGASMSTQAALLDDLAAANLSATGATVSFCSTDAGGADTPTRSVLQWGKTNAYGQQTDEQFASGAIPGEPISGLRAMYIEGLEPATEYFWKVSVKDADGAVEESEGTFKTLPVDQEKKRGPDGSHKPPHTPAYETPATHVATTWEEVNDLLRSCSGGEVIEVAEGDSSGSGVIVLTGGSDQWETNVLIRPALGERASNKSRGVEINSPHITVAGFNLPAAHMYPKYSNKHPANSDGIGAKRAFFWMCNLERGGSLLANGCPDSGWFEVVSLKRGVGGDRAQIKTYADIAPDNFTVAGCWLEGKDRTNSKDHCDTLQTLGFGKTITGLKLLDTVFFRSANCCGQLTDLSGTMIENCWFGPLVEKSKVCGSFYATLGANTEAVIRNSDWNGSFRQDANPKEITNSSFPKLDKPGEISEGNRVGEGLQPQPPLPDLNTIWPK